MPRESGSRARTRRPLALPSAAVLALTFVSASASAQQTIEWARTIGGDFDVAGYWLPGVVPGPADTAVLGVVVPDRRYTVAIDQDASVAHLWLSNPLATLSIGPGANFMVGQQISGPGALVVNAERSFLTARLRLGDGAKIGTSVLLNAQAGRSGGAIIERAGSGTPPVFAPGVAIRGRGVLYGDHTIHGTVEASDGPIDFRLGRVRLGDTGQVLAGPDTSYTVSNGAIVSGGTWRASTGHPGTLRGDGTGAIADAVLEGAWAIEPQNAVMLAGDIAGPGSILVNRDPAGGFSTLQIAADSVIGVDVVLSPSEARAGAIVRVGDGAAPVFTDATTISGSGEIRGGAQILGRVEVAGAGSRIELVGGHVAVGPAAVLAVDGGQLWATDGSLAGGRIESAGGGVLRLDGATVEHVMLASDGQAGLSGDFRSLVADCTLEGDWLVDGGTFRSVTLGGAIGGPGALTINRPTSSTAATVNVAGGARIGVPIRLDKHEPGWQAALLRWEQDGERPTLGPAARITGHGRLAGGLAIQSGIEADGGTITLEGGAFDLAAGVIVRALPGASLGIDQARVIGGVWDGGTIGTDLAGEGFATIEGGRFEGLWRIGRGSGLRLAGHTRGPGTLVVGPDGPGASGRLPVEADVLLDVHLALDAPPAEPSRATLSRLPGGGTATLGASGVLSGSGLLVGDFTIAGTLRPGTGMGDPGLLEPRAGTLTLADTARVEILAGGPVGAGHPRIAGPATIELAGPLALAFADFYTPAGHDVFEVVAATTLAGAFDEIDIQPVPALEAIGPPHAVSTGHAVRIVLCAADRDGDGELTAFDLLAYMNQHAAGDPAADLDADGALTLFDFLAFQNRFQAGCR
ncbi:MAG: GC-type dockerin domain-anchored protein [Phycisphaerales bacterium JB060]